MRMCDDTQRGLNVSVQKKFHSVNEHGVSNCEKTKTSM